MIQLTDEHRNDDYMKIFFYEEKSFYEYSKWESRSYIGLECAYYSNSKYQLILN